MAWWDIPGSRWGAGGETPSEAYWYFVWQMGRATWYRHMRMGWPLERITHYLAIDARKRRNR